jgi:UDP-N-acetylglucosamine 2-epimerase (hydrolysing)
MRKVLFLTGTRADFGKLKSLLYQLECKHNFEVHIFVTGMHMLKKYGYTYDEIEKCGFKNIYKYINQNHSDTMDSILAKTVQGFSDYVKEIDPSIIIVHGDRVEALAGAIVGSLNNILVAHIEGGEVSGTVDGLMRHAITKMSHLHFAANQVARKRLLQLGEAPESIYEIGSPDMDILVSQNLPTLEEVKKRYEISFEKYSILLFHPVTTELANLRQDIENLVDCVLEDSRNYVVIYPNNDEGTDTIFYEYNRFKSAKKL